MSALPRPLPTHRDENWKYANLRGLARARFDAAPPPAPALISDVAAMLPPPLPGFPRIVLVDGHPLPALSASQIVITYLNPPAPDNTCTAADCKAVRVSLHNLSHQALIPLVPLRLTLPPFATTQRKEFMNSTGNEVCE